MINEITAGRVIEKALSKGGDFAEIFCENTVKNNISMVNGHIDNVSSGIDYGAGIRVFDGMNAIYVYTNDLSEQGLLKTAGTAADAIGEKSNTASKEFEQYEYKNRNIIKIMPGEKSKREKRDILKEASDEALPTAV